MKQIDRVLVGIVAGILVLVAAAFFLVLSQPAPEYQSEDTPEHIAHNYLLALRQQEYDRAYGYLSPNLVNYPATLNQFIQDIEDNSWSFRLDTEVTLAVASARVVNNHATVTIEETRFYNSGLFDSYQSVTTFVMVLNQENGSWKITQADTYWKKCWHSDAAYCS